MSALRWRQRAGGARRAPWRHAAAGRVRRRPRTRRAIARWRPGPRTLIALIAVVLLLGGGFLWLRTSSLVAVKRVTISGVNGPDAVRIESALRRAARTMTTLDVRLGQLDAAVAPYPAVKRLDVSTQFPHGMRIVVHEEIPVGLISLGGTNVAVAADGTLLHSAAGGGELPVIPVRVLPGGIRVSDPSTVWVVELLAAAPWQLRARIGQAQYGAAHGLVAQVRGGPELIFGDSTQLAAKWAAVAAVLASPDSAGAQYVDVSDPRRPAAGADVSSTTTTAATTATVAAPAAATPTPAAATPTPAAAAPAAVATGPTGG